MEAINLMAKLRGKKWRVFEVLPCEIWWHFGEILKILRGFLVVGLRLDLWLMGLLEKGAFEALVLTFCRHCGIIFSLEIEKSFAR